LNDDGSPVSTQGPVVPILMPGRHRDAGPDPDGTPCRHAPGDADFWGNRHYYCRRT
jgi:hypothetical protein